MIIATFKKKNGNFCGFNICGHSGYSEAGSDIVCAAVSSMAMLTINTVSEKFNLPVDLTVDEENADIRFSLKTEDRYASALLSGLANELSALENDYPNNVRIIIN